MSQTHPGEHSPSEPTVPDPQWPDCLTPEDIRLMQALDIVLRNVVTEAVQKLADTAWSHRMHALDALMASRGNRLN